MFTIPNLTEISARDEALGEALKAISAQLSPTAPLPPASLKVTAAHGIFDVLILGPKGVEYVLEYALSPSFENAASIYLGPSRTYRGFLGNQTLYWRARSYNSGFASDPVLYPKAVVGGGFLTGPVPLRP